MHKTNHYIHANLYIYTHSNTYIHHTLNSSFQSEKINQLLRLCVFRRTAMAEIGQTSTEVYAPTTTTLQVWRTLLNWLTFFFQIFVQIVRGTPSVASFINYSSTTTSFKPLPVVEFPEDSESSNLDTASVHIPNDDCLEKLTVRLIFIAISIL